MRKFLTVAALALLVGGCGTIINGSRSSVRIDSNPTKASFVVVSAGGGIGSSIGMEVAKGVTPAVVELSHKSNYQVTISYPGFEDVKVPVSQDFSYWTLCSAICGLIPAGVDVLTGGAWKLEPETIAIGMKQIYPQQPAPASTPVPAAPTQPALPPPPPPPPGSTVQGPIEQGPSLYVVLMRKDPEGQIRYLAIPLVAKKS